MSKVVVTLLLLAPILWGTNAYGDRKPLPRPSLKKIDHKPTGTNIRSDPKTQQPIEYELDGKITYDEKSGNFFLTWNGLDGQRKTIVYEAATKLDAVIAAAVDYDSQNNVYRYSYLLSNLPTSRQKLQSFYLETKAPIREVQAPEAWNPDHPTWYSRALTKYLQEELEVEGGWVWSDVLRGRVGLHPGQEVAGFSFLSPGLPAIVKCYVRHYGKLKGVGEEPPEELLAAIHGVAWKIPQGVTVGPAAPPQRIDAASFARRIIEILDVSEQQGWIESPAVAKELRTLLNGLVAALEGHDRKQASSVLPRLLQLVEQENNRTLLPEAYALLKYNLEFLRKNVSSN